MFHSSTWNGAELIFQTSSGVTEHRYLENYKSDVSLHPTAVASRPSNPEQVRLKRPPQINSTADSLGGTLVNLRIWNKTDPSSSISPSANWNQLCSRAGLDQSSRVLITDIIRQPAATLSALSFADRCHVRIVVGTDTLFPNLRVSRLRYMQTYKKLIQNIPNFRLVVTELGLSRANDNSVPSWLWEFNPTHILISDHVRDDKNVDSAMTQTSYQLYIEKHNDRVWNDLLSALSLQKKRKMAQSPRLVHMRTSFASDAERTRQTVNSYLPMLYATPFHRNITRLVLPHLYGPGSSLLTHFDDPLSSNEEFEFTVDAPHIYVDNALKAIVTAFARPLSGGYRDLKIPESAVLSTKAVKSAREDDAQMSRYLRRAMAWSHYIRNPFGEPRSQTPKKDEGPLSKTESLGSISHLPCSSQCVSPHLVCQKSVFDDLVETSQEVSNKCEHVVYMGNFSNSLASLPSIEDEKPVGLCRFAFLSKGSKLVQSLAKKEQASLPALNGKLTHKGWVLMWPTRNLAEFSRADHSLLRIDPSMLFSKTVRKALFAGSDSFAQISNSRAMQLIRVADTKGFKKGQRHYHEQRSGTNLKRWVPIPESKPRHSVLFAGALFPVSMGQVAPEVIVRGRNYSKHQVEFYKQVAHRVHTNIGRPEFEIRSTLFKTFPFQWISPFFLVHDLHLEEARLLRCEWLEEHVSWTNMDNVEESPEELSLGFILGRRKTLELIGEKDSNAAVQGFMPLLVPESDGDVVVDKTGAEVFVGILEHAKES